MQQWFSDIGVQAAQDSGPWEVENKWTDPCGCSSFPPIESFPVEGREGFQIGPGYLFEL